MKKLMIPLFMAVFLSACGETADETPVMESDEDKFAYVVGYQNGKNLGQVYLSEENMAAFEMGLREGLKGDEAQFSMQEQQAITRTYMAKARQKMEAEMVKKTEESLVASQAWLAENGKKEGVMSTESGLQYKVIKEGDGDTPGPEDTVEVHYKGSLIDGTVFNDSRADNNNRTVEFTVNRVIKGWAEALQLMKTGSVYELYIPPELAYGANAPASIGPNQALIFEVELISIVSKAEAATEEAAPAE